MFGMMEWKSQIFSYLNEVDVMHEVLARGILSQNNGMNLYRGCSHGCIYCDSRSRCYHMEHAFEDIEVKKNCLELLDRELGSRRNQAMVSTGSMTDPYLPLEKHLKYTRASLELIEKHGFGAAVLTKSSLVLRDLDIIRKIHAATRFVLEMTLTTIDEDLCRILEPHVATTRERAEVLFQFRDEGIPTVVWLSPILPFINDTEENLVGLLELCKEAKVKAIMWFGAGLTLRSGNREFFYQALDRHFPGLKEKYTATYGEACSILSPNNRELSALLAAFCQKHGIIYEPPQVFTYLNLFEEKIKPVQLSFFDR